jgi:hypothetical protein
MPNTGGGAIDCMKIHLGPQSLKITQCIQCKSPLILKNQFWYTSLFVLFFSTWLERERREREREGLLDSDDERESHRLLYF